MPSNRILGSCNTGMQCCGQAALCPLCREHSLGWCCVPTVLSTALWKHLSAFLCLSFYPHDLWTNGPIAGTRSKRSGALWDKLVLQMSKRETLWHKMKGMEGVPTQNTGPCFIRFVPWLMGEINQQLHLTRQINAEDTNLQKTRLPCWNAQNFIFKQTVYVCIMDFLLQPDPYAIAERKTWAKMYFRRGRSNSPLSQETGQGISCNIVLHVRRSQSFILWSSWELQEEKHGNML